MNLKNGGLQKSLPFFFKKDETFFDKFRLNNTGKRLGARIKELLNNL